MPSLLKTMPWLRFAIREVLNSRRFTIFFILNLALGLSGFVAIDAFKSSIQYELQSGSKNLLGADITVKCSNRSCTAEEIAQLTVGIRAHVVTMFTMTAFGERSKLSQLVAATGTYPHYGGVTFKEEIGTQDFKRLNETKECWLFPEIAIQLGVKLGDVVRIGETSFTVSGIVEQDATATASAFGFVPRVYIGESYLSQTQLVSAGSRFNDTYALKLAQSDEKQVEHEEKRLQAALTSKEVTVTSHKKSSANLERALTSLSDYLGLVALVALFLSAMGSAYLFRSFLVTRAKDIAILVSLGASPFRAKLVYALQLFLLGTAAAMVSLGFAALSFPFVPLLTKGLLPLSVYPTLHAKVAGIALLMGSVGSVLICLPLLHAIGTIKPNQLLNEVAEPISWRGRGVLLYVPVALLYWGLAILESNSYLTGSIFTGGMLVAIICFTVVSYTLFTALRYIPRLPFYNLRMALRHLSRQRWSSSACFLALGFAAMLINLVPQIYNVVEEEINTPKGFQLPSLFLVDIQQDQVDALQTFLGDHNTTLDALSPLIRARLNGINDIAEVKGSSDDETFSREEERAQWARTRGQNLTIREKLAPSERLIDGKEFTGAYDPTQPDVLPEISIEMRYAQRLGVTVGDRLTFDIQGVDVTGKIVNIRRVRWTSFQPNFFVSFQPGVIDDAPKSYLASIPFLEEGPKLQLQTDLVARFPNISIVDVASTITRILDILYRMGSIVVVMAIFALFVGAVVLFSIANHQAFLRRYEVNLLKILGHNFYGITKMIIFEFVTLAFCASCLGVILSTVISYVVAQMIFDSPFHFSIYMPLATIGAVTVLSIFTALLASRRVLLQRPVLFLN